MHVQISIIRVCVCVCVEVSTESVFTSSADITLPTVFQTAKVLQTIHMGESQARHRSEVVIFFPIFFPELTVEEEMSMKPQLIQAHRTLTIRKLKEFSIQLRFCTNN